MVGRHLTIVGMFLCFILIPAIAQARMVHDFDCTLCHLEYSDEEKPYMTYNVCLDCHYPGNEGTTYQRSDGSDSNPITATFAAGDGSNALGSNDAPDAETSHFFAGASDTAPEAGATPPSNFRFNLGWANGQVTCSRCHNPHGDTSNPKLLKLGADSADTMCLDCHSSWDQASNHGRTTHPLVDDYPTFAAANADSYRDIPDNFETTGGISLVNSVKVSCSSCHKAHFADSDASTSDVPAASLSDGDGKLLKSNGPGRENPDQSLCHACHIYNQHGADSALGCKACHGGHEYDAGGNPNYFMLKKQVALDFVPKTGLAGTVNLDYTAYPPPGNLNGICQQCHTLPSGHHEDDTCKECHSHDLGFAHGSATTGVGCIECHGHDVGTPYDADQQAPYSAGVAISQGKGSAQSHSTHTETDADDQKGSPLYCDSCHDTDNYPYFKSGTDADGDGKFNLAETDVCDTCHSPGGVFNGVDTTGTSIGAKDNWSTGIYADRTFAAGKEMWCVGCHDNDPGNSRQNASGIDAQNVVGDNITYGFSVNGHGRDPSINCLYCHSAAKKHIDHQYWMIYLHYDVPTNPTNYRFYDGKGLEIPLRDDNANLGESALCFSCHDEALASEENPATNFRQEGGSNLHRIHVLFGTGSNQVNAPCAFCHDPHGTTNPRMTASRIGELKLLRYDADAGKFFELADPAQWNTAANVGAAKTALVPTIGPPCNSCHHSTLSAVTDYADGFTGGDGRDFYTRDFIDLSATYGVNFDFDGDDANDDVDNCVELVNADQADNDGDGVGNVCDNCPDKSNLGQEDSDLNGAGDVCDIPDTPANNTPVEGATITTPKPTLTSSAFAEPHPAHTHQASQWQITTSSGNYSSPFYDSGSTADLISHNVALPLNGATTYYWHVRHQDNQGSWSEYSAETSFLTANLAPNMPVNSAPANLASGVAVAPFLESLPFSDQDGDGHQSSQWQVSPTSGDYAAPAYDSGPVADLASHQLSSDLTSATVYYWRVRHEDDQGNWSNYSSETSFTTLIRPPNTPDNFSPVNGALSLGLTVELTSSDFSDLDIVDTHLASHWQVTTSEGDYTESPSLIINSTNSDLASHTISGLIADETYYWHVRHQDSAGNWSDFSTETSFTTNQPPNIPVHISPANGTTDSSLVPTLVTTFSDPDSGDTLKDSLFWISLTNGYNLNIEYFSTRTSAASVTVPADYLDPSTTYYWYATHRDSFDNESNYSVRSSFTTSAAPNQPFNVSPISETILTGTPTLSASVFIDPDAGNTHASSQWQLSTTSNFQSLVYDNIETMDPTSHTVTVQQWRSRDYYWRVRYKDNNGAWSEYSTQSSFRINGAPATPACVSPAHFATDEAVAITLRSSAFSDPDNDTHLASQWQITTTNGDYSTPAYDSGATTDLTSHTMPTAADNATTYFWHVRHQDENGQWSAYSSARKFTTVDAGTLPPNTPTTSSPANNATGLIITPTLSSSAFSPGEAGNTHAASQWQITTSAGNYGSPAYDSGVSTGLTSHIVTDDLNNATEYFWQVRHMDNQGTWSAYSNESSFTTETAAPQTVTIYPTALADTNDESLWVSPNGSSGSLPWADLLATDDGDTSYVAACCNYAGDYFYVDMEDLPAELSGAAIQSIKVIANARYLEGPWPDAPPVAATFELHYKTGPIPLMQSWETQPENTYMEFVDSYNQDAEGGSLDPTDVNNLQIGIMRGVEGPQQLLITAIRAEVTYIP